MPKAHFTAKYIDNLKATNGQVDYFDSALPGFGIRIGKTRKTYFLTARIDGKQARLKVGLSPEMTLKEAREKALEFKSEIEVGNDPRVARNEQQEAKRIARQNTFESVCLEWLERDQSQNRSAKNVAAAMQNDFLKDKAFATRPLGSISRAEFIRKLDAIIDRGAKTHANRVHAYLMKMLGWAEQRGIIDGNVMAGTAKPAKEISRDRILTDDELRNVWIACGDLGWPFGPLVRLLIATGQRREEVTGLSWSEIEGELWTLPRHRAKNDTEHKVPLSKLALQTLDGVPHIANLIFTTTGKTPASGHSNAKKRLDKLSGTDNWRFHDLRRTMASNMARLGIDIATIERLLNHRSGTLKGIVAVYQRHDFANEKRLAVSAWAGWLRLLVADGNGDLWVQVIARIMRSNHAGKVETFAENAVAMMAPEFRNLTAHALQADEQFWSALVDGIIEPDAKLADNLRTYTKTPETALLVSGAFGAEIIDIGGTK